VIASVPGCKTEVKALKGTSEVKALKEALDALDLPEVQRDQLKARYLYYVKWLESNATGSRRGHYTMRLIAAVGSVIVTSMSSAQVLGSAPRVVSWILLGQALPSEWPSQSTGFSTSAIAGGTIEQRSRD
jgi:hypothetical protein